MLSIENETPDLIIGEQALLREAGLARSTYYWLRRRGRFPLPVRMGLRCVGWKRADVEAWRQQAAAERGQR